jgi:hypothetical protein
MSRSLNVSHTTGASPREVIRRDPFHREAEGDVQAAGQDEASADDQAPARALAEDSRHARSGSHHFPPWTHDFH